jgi:hypothetical protein
MGVGEGNATGAERSRAGGQPGRPPAGRGRRTRRGEHGERLGSVSHPRPLQRPAMRRRRQQRRAGRTALACWPPA